MDAYIQAMVAPKHSAGEPAASSSSTQATPRSAKRERDASPYRETVQEEGSPIAPPSSARVVLSDTIQVKERISGNRTDISFTTLWAARRTSSGTPCAPSLLPPPMSMPLSGRSRGSPSAAIGASSAAEARQNRFRPSESPVAPADAPEVTSARAIRDCLIAMVGNQFKFAPEGQSWRSFADLNDEDAPLPRASFPFVRSDVEQVLDVSLALLTAEPTVIDLAAESAHPIRIFGDIHGQLHDLMAFFHHYGSPWTLRNQTFVFLGDFVDRGDCSFHVLMLLLSLKVLYPDRVFLIRGNHEDIEMSFAKRISGKYQNQFGMELMARLPDERDRKPIEEQIAGIFDHMPLGVVIGSSILCVHGGIGPAFTSIAQLRAVRKPVVSPQPEDYRNCIGGHPVACTALWSDPNSRSAKGIPTERGRDGTCHKQYMATFSRDDVDTFCASNRIDVIIRAHECPRDGVDMFAEGKCITVFSATRYEGDRWNAGAVMDVLRKENGKIVLQPLLLVPMTLGQFQPRGGLERRQVRNAKAEIGVENYYEDDPEPLVQEQVDEEEV